MWIPDSKNDLLASLLVQDAARAVTQVFADHLQRHHGIAHALFRSLRNHLEDAFFNRSRLGKRRSLAWTHLFSQFQLVSLLDIRYGDCRRGLTRRRPPVEVVNAQFVVETDSLGDRAAKFRIQGAGHWG